MASRRSKCGVKEMAPGVWVTIDCTQIPPAQDARPHLSPQKAKFISNRKFAMSSAGVERQARARKNPNLDKATREELPQAVDLRAQNLDGPIKNQEYVGACSAFGLSAAIDNALRKAGRQETVSPAHVWGHYGFPAVSEAIALNAGKPLASRETFPYSGRTGCLLAKGSASYDEDCADYYKVKLGGWREDAPTKSLFDSAEATPIAILDKNYDYIVYPGKRANTEELMTLIASGTAAWAVIDFTYDAWRVYGKDATIKDVEHRDATHAVTLMAYRTTPQGVQFLIHNSWGTSWGDGGYAWMSEKMAMQHTWAYRIKLSNLPPAQPTDDDCDFDELIDASTLKCAKICADDSRPNNGCGR